MDKYLSVITNFGCHYQCPECVVKNNGLKMPDGTIVEGKLDSWHDYDGEQVQVVIDGVTYLVSSMNLVMISH